MMMSPLSLESIKKPEETKANFIVNETKRHV